MSEVPLNEKPLNATEWAVLNRGQLTTMSSTCVEFGCKDPWTSNNSHIWTYQPHCQSCFSQNSLVVCPTCCGVAHCAKEECIADFKSLHNSNACEAYCVRLAAYVMALQQGNYLKVSTQSRKSSPLPSSWAEYFRLALTDFEVPPQLINLPPVMAQLTDSLSMVLTAVNAMQSLYASLDPKSGSVKGSVDLISAAGVDLKSSESLSALRNQTAVSIHFIGAEVTELIGMESAMEEIMHWLPECRTLDVVLIGPSLPRLKDESGGDVDGVRRLSLTKLCDGCACCGCKLYITTAQKLYHNAVDEGIISACPSLAVCLNSGLHEESGGLAMTWRPTVELLHRKRIPTLFTGYCEAEIRQDAERVQQICAEVSVELNADRESSQAVFCGPMLNPFRGLLPMPEPFKDNAFFYYSCYTFSMV